MAFIEKLINRLVTWGGVLGAVSMITVIIIIIAGVIARALGHGLSGTLDLVESIIVLVGSFSFAYCQIHDRHARADIIIMHLSPRMKAWFETFTGILGIAFWSVMTWAGWRMLVTKYEDGEATDIININLVPFRALWVISLALMVIVLIIKLIHSVREGVSK